jgi:hypothetical protein
MIHAHKRSATAPAFVRIASAMFALGASFAADSAYAWTAAGGRRGLEDPVAAKDTPWLLAVPDFKPGDGGVAGGDCPQVTSTYTNASFEGGQYILQAGFAEGEIAATSYTLNPSDFPLRINLIEMIFATSNAAVATTTKWSVIVWQGTPATGTVAYSYSSDGVVLPHLQMSPGTNGTNVQFGIDPADPEQMVVLDNGSHTFSVGFRIDDHNNQTADPCLVAPPPSSNAFPTTDVGGLAAPTTNWLYLINCGALGCPPGWKTFAQLPAVCRPSGDWVMRVTWTPQQCEIPGACCLPNGTCQVLTNSACVAQGGTFTSEGSQCTGSTCTQNICPCCFPATGGCLTLSPAACQQAGGIAGPTGQSCTGYVCFPTGACCLPNGTCIGPVSPAACAAQNGVFQGNATTCSPGLCPEPFGAACFPNGFCIQLTAAQAADAGAVWKGPGTSCADGDGDGTADACEASNPADLNGDGVVGAADIAILLSAWGAAGGPADLNGDGVVGSADITILLSSWG